MKVVGYIRVSTVDQANSGLGVEAQKDRISTAASVKGWDVSWIIDTASGAQADNRPGLQQALEGLQKGEWSALVCAKLDRLSRSVVDLSRVLQTAESEGWGVILLDLDLDTTTSSGRLVAHVMSAVAEFERQRISERTAEALAQARRNGTPLGRPRVLSPTIVDRIVAERDSGRSLSDIANRLNRDNIATAHGGKMWYHSTIAAVLRSNRGAAVGSSL